MTQITPLTKDLSGKVTVEMTTAEYLEFAQKHDSRRQRQVVKGLGGLMQLFGCSRSKAYVISHQEWFQPAIIIRSGKFVSFDGEIAMELAQKNSFGSKE